MRAPKKPKPNGPKPGLRAMHETQQFCQQPAAIPKWVRVYIKAVARWDMSKFHKRVGECPDECKPQLAKRLTDDLVVILAAKEQSSPADCVMVSENSPITEAVTRIVVALNNGLPLNQVVACLTATEPRPCQVRALSLLLRDCVLEANKPVDLLSWTQCIGESTSAQEWMTQLGESLALDSKSDGRLLQYWLSAMTSLADQVQSQHPTASDLVLALLNGFDGVCNLDLDLDLNADVNPHALGEARVTCGRLRAQLTHEAERLVNELDAVVRKASALANEDIAQPAGAEERKRRIREDSQVQELCKRIVDGLAGGVLTLKEVVGALEQFSSGSETVAALMHVLVVQAKSKGLHTFFRSVLHEAARPDELVLYMAPALLDSGGDIRLAAGLVERLAHEAIGAFTRLLSILRLIEELCLPGERSQTLSPLNETVRGMVREAAARLVMEAMRRVESATGNLFKVFNIEPTARLTAAQLEQLGGELLEGSIEAIVQPLGSRMAGAYVLEALHSFIDRPACGYLVSLLVRALLQRGAALNVFMGALVNADVPPEASKAHTLLAQQLALGFADWVPGGLGLEDRIGVWIGTVVVKPGASVIGFEVLQVILDDLVSHNKWGPDIKSSLVRCRSQVEKRLMAAKAESLIKQYIVPVIELIARTRNEVFGAEECSLSLLEEDVAKFLPNKDIDDGATKLVRAVRRSDISMRAVIEGLSFGHETVFDWQLLLLKFIGPLFQESAASFPYELNNFMNSLFDVDRTSEFFSEVGIVFSAREESATDRDRMIGTIQTLFDQYKGDKLKLSRLQSFATEYQEGTSEDENSRRLDALLDAIDAQLESKDASSGIADISSVPQPTIAIEQGISLLPPAGIPPGVPPQSGIGRSPALPNFGLQDQNRPAVSLIAEPLPLLSEPNPGPRGVDGLPSHYSGYPFQENTYITPIPSWNEANIFEKNMAEALNGGRMDAVKTMVNQFGMTVLNLAKAGVPMLGGKGLETLGELVSDPSVVLQELILGTVTRGITKLIEGMKKSKHLIVLNVQFFNGLEKVETNESYRTSAVFLMLGQAYEKQNLSLKQLVVSRAALSDEINQKALDSLKGAAGSRLNVELR
jgi:hypothetical protein